MELNGIKVTTRDAKYGYIDFIVSNDSENVYRYENSTKKMRKLFGIGRNNYGKALRGSMRQKVEEMAKIAYENGLPFVLFEA